MSQASVKKLAKHLQDLGYQGLFRMPDSEQKVNSLWNEPGNPDRLLQLAGDTTQPWQTRFLAAELIFHQQMFDHRPEHFASLAQVYAAALRENASGFMADWGFLENVNDVGKLGNRFILFGRDSTSALKPLLDQSRAVPYVYPPEFPSRIRLGIRVQDFAALYLSKIYDIPLRLTEDPTQRDGEIGRLKSLLP
jgi:hypothetical protein